MPASMPVPMPLQLQQMQMSMPVPPAFPPPVPAAAAASPAARPGQAIDEADPDANTFQTDRDSLVVFQQCNDNNQNTERRSVLSTLYNYAIRFADTHVYMLSSFLFV